MSDWYRVFPRESRKCQCAEVCQLVNECQPILVWQVDGIVLVLGLGMTVDSGDAEANGVVHTTIGFLF